MQDEIRSTVEFIEPLTLDPKDPAACEALTQTLRTYGLALVRTPEFSPAIRSQFLDQMLDYLTSCLAIRDGRLIIDIPADDLRPDLGYQYGPTPIGEETALCAQEDNHERCKAFVDRLDPKFKPVTVPGSAYPDRKGRFMAHLVTYRDENPPADHPPVGRLSTDPATTVAEDPQNIIPGYLAADARDRFVETMNAFGMMMLNPLFAISRMLATGLGVDPDYFVRLMHDGHHKVAPTFASFYQDRSPQTIQAALHEDIDVFAIHAQGTHSGLFVYTETGERLRVSVPEGCLLVQAGRQLYLRMRSMVRAGEIDVEPIQPGWHEVLVTDDALEKAMPAIEQIDATMRRSDLTDEELLSAIRPLYRECIRISGTFFFHFGDGVELIYGLPDGELEEGTFPEGTRTQRYIGLELGFIKLKK
jgi:hypothetical protein